jgi:hypothetical protein
MTALMTGSAILLLAAMAPKPYPQSWYQRWSRHTSSKSLR